MFAGTWILFISINVFLFVYLCPMRFDSKLRIVTFIETELCVGVVWYAGFVKNIIVVGVFMIIDIITVIKVRKVRLFSVNNKNKNNESISEREKRFLQQTVSQGIVFTTELITWFSIAKITSNQFVIFLFTNYAFLAIHVLDGIIVLLFNPEIRSFLGSAKKKPVNNLVKISVTTTV
ncbi:unnamed protein product [Caenorhabditis nigoni]